MLISIDLDSLMLPECTDVTRMSIARILSSWHEVSATTSLLILWDECCSPALLHELQDWMHALGWGGDRCQWVGWRPFPVTGGPLRRQMAPKVRQINRRIRLGLARWHGAKAHIWLTTWPEASGAGDELPQGLVIFADAWAPTPLQRLLVRWRRPLLRGRLRGYEAVSIDSASALLKLLDGDAMGSSPAMLARVLSRAKQLEASQTASSVRPVARPRMAWVTPMPPERTGIADYCASLLNDLNQHYDVTVITEATPPPGGRDRWRSTAWLQKNGWRFDQICYHIGNSPFHRKIRDCLDLWPGAVVLHEFYLGDLEYSFESWMGMPNQRWLRELYLTHGYKALIGADGPGQPHSYLRAYPCDGSILKRAFGVIVHSRHAVQLLSEQVGPESSMLIEQVPFARADRALPERSAARQALSLDADELLICSFGMPGASKLSREIADAWLDAVKLSGCRSRLVFVGGHSGDPYGASLEAALQDSAFGTHAMITGWVDPELYELYLAACDIAVQLRTISRGETSAAVLDCICAGIPTVVNRLGSLSELPENSVIMLPATPTRQDLAEALRELCLDEKRRQVLAHRAATLQAGHRPSLCALAYRESLERIYAGQRASEYRTLQGIGAALPVVGIDRIGLSQNLAHNFPRTDRPRQLLVDVSAIARSDYKTGIQRVVRALILEFIQMSIPGYRVEPVWLSSAGGRWHYRYARRWTCKLLELAAPSLEDQSIETRCGDVLFIADLTCGYLLESERCYILPRLIEQGIKIQAIVYDILPLQLPHYFPAGIDSSHGEWLTLLATRASTLFCISEAVATDARAWLQAHQPESLEHLTIDWFHLGADLENSSPTKGMPEDLDKLTNSIEAGCSFLMVGTIEPRKGYAQVIKAFEQLRAEGHPFNLVILGKVGWMMEGLIHELTTNPCFDNSIFWYESASDEFLRWLYQQCQCLIAASEGEGFGLPLIEAALHGMPMLVRDLPVFREVAGEGAMYFSGSTPEDMAAAILEWHRSFRDGRHPDPRTITWQTWRESAEQLLQRMRLGGKA